VEGYGFSQVRVGVCKGFTGFKTPAGTDKGYRFSTQNTTKMAKADYYLQFHSIPVLREFFLLTNNITKPIAALISLSSSQADSKNLNT
jgi:hypothetical protein